MRIAVLSDTHDRFPSWLPHRLKSADEIWHLGDVCEPKVMFEFQQLGPPLHIVRGNCDSHDGWPWELRLERAGTVCWLTHIPPEKVPPGVHVVLHGHTHVPRDEERDGIRWLNPGCITRPRGAGASYAWLTFEPGQPPAWKTVPMVSLLA